MQCKNRLPAPPVTGPRSSDTREAIHGCLGVCSSKISFCEEGTITEVSQGSIQMGGAILIDGHWDCPNGSVGEAAIGTVPMGERQGVMADGSWSSDLLAGSSFSVSPHYLIRRDLLNFTVAAWNAIAVIATTVAKQPCAIGTVPMDGGLTRIIPSAMDRSEGDSNGAGLLRPLGQSQWHPTPLEIRSQQPNRWDCPNGREDVSSARAARSARVPRVQLFASRLELAERGRRLGTTEALNHWDSPNGLGDSATGDGKETCFSHPPALVGGCPYGYRRDAPDAPRKTSHWDCPNGWLVAWWGGRCEQGLVPTLQVRAPLGLSQWGGSGCAFISMYERLKQSNEQPAPGRTSSKLLRRGDGAGGRHRSCGHGVAIGTVPMVDVAIVCEPWPKKTFALRRSTLFAVAAHLINRKPLGQSQWSLRSANSRGMKAFNRRAVGAVFRVAALSAPHTASVVDAAQTTKEVTR